MNLYCEACNQVHRFSGGEVEALVYALEAMQRYDPEIARLKTRPEPDEATCLRSLLELAYNPEGFAEHVQVCRDRRLDKAVVHVG